MLCPLSLANPDGSRRTTQKGKLSDVIYSQSARLSKRQNLSEAIYCRTKKSSEAPDRFTRRSAHLFQKRFVPDNTCFVDANFLHNCSLGMQKQDGYEQVKGKVERYLQETIISDKTAQDEEALWKKLLPNLLVTFYIYTDEFG